MPFPPELITMFGTGALTAMMRLKTLSMKNQMKIVEMAILKSKAEIESMDAAAKRGGTIASLLRAFIILSMMIVFVFPTVGPLIERMKDVPVFLTYYEEHRKILGLFGSLADKLRVIEIPGGIVIQPDFRHMIAAVFGYLFGAGAVKA